MSEREQVKQIIDQLSDYKISHLLLFLRGVQFADEMSDDKFCEQLINNYESSTDKGDFVSFDEAVKMCGVDIDAIQN